MFELKSVWMKKALPKILPNLIEVSKNIGKAPEIGENIDLILFVCFSAIVGALFLSWEGVGSVLSAGGIGNDLKWPIKSKKQTQEETKLWREEEPI